MSVTGEGFVRAMFLLLNSAAISRGRKKKNANFKDLLCRSFSLEAPSSHGGGATEAFQKYLLFELEVKG